jgi:hypothetical protein
VLGGPATTRADVGPRIGGEVYSVRRGNADADSLVQAQIAAMHDAADPYCSHPKPMPGCGGCVASLHAGLARATREGRDDDGRVLADTLAGIVLPSRDPDDHYGATRD